MPEIAIILGNTRRTVEFHLTNARQKLGVSSLPQAVAEALRRGIIN
jgi:DNA-binding CsgD family transcriptional regulator